MIKSYSVVFIAYLIALVVVIVSHYWHTGFIGNPLLSTFTSDVIATVVIFIFSALFRNASIYDPYWSLIPPIIIWYWGKEFDDASVKYYLILSVVSIWGLRLTLNWLRRWRGLSDEDFRYKELRKKSGMFYPVVNLLGIHLFPTSIVFVALIPAYFAITIPERAIGFIDLAATLICLLAIAIELIADEQLKRFLKHRKTETVFISTGLWKYSRHPNYFGEVLFWWGIYLFALGTGANYAWTMLGALAMTIMFIFISIPMMDKRMLEKKPGYTDEMRKVSGLVPWFRKE